MNKKAFANAILGINYGDNIIINYRGIYNIYIHEGILKKIERGFVFLERGQAHSYRKIISIKKKENSHEKDQETSTQTAQASVAKSRRNLRSSFGKDG